MSTLKRSRSFRASMKLMSKIRNHATLRLTAGFDLSSVSKDLIVKEGRNLSVLEEFQDGERPLNLRKDFKDMNFCVKDKIGEASPSPRKISVSNFDADSREITKDLKTKLSLTDKLMGKSHKDVEKFSKNEDVKSPKIIHIFRRRHSIENSQKDTREKDCSDKHASCETDTNRLNKHVSYENPTFVDSSLDSSVSSFLFEVEEEEEVEKQRQEQDERATSSKCNVLTVVVNSHKAATNRLFYRKMSYDEDKEHLSRDTFRPRCETNPLRRSCEVKSENSHTINMINRNRRTTESFSEFDRPKIKLYCKVHETERKNAMICLQNQKIDDDIKTCPSKSYKINNIGDNIANFWTGRRGNSFRNKIVTDKKRDTKETKDYERFDQEQVFMSTSLGSSTLDQ